MQLSSTYVGQWEIPEFLCLIRLISLSSRCTQCARIVFCVKRPKWSYTAVKKRDTARRGGSVFSGRLFLPLLQPLYTFS